MTTVDGTEPIGSVEEVFQEDDPYGFPVPATVGVEVRGPVQTQALPSVSSGSRSWAVAAVDAPKLVAKADPRRRTVRVWGTQPFYVGETANEVKSGYSALAAANQIVTITHADDVFIFNTVDGVFSVMVENWAS